MIAIPHAASGWATMGFAVLAAAVTWGHISNEVDTLATAQSADRAAIEANRAVLALHSTQIAVLNTKLDSMTQQLQRIEDNTRR